MRLCAHNILIYMIKEPSIALALVLLLAAAPATAHESRPLYVQFTETDPGLYIAYWKVPTSLPQGALPSPVLPASCTAEAEPAMQQRDDAYEFQQRFSCAEGLSGQTVGIHFPVLNPSITSLVQVKLASGEQHLKILKPGEENWVVPERENRLAVASQYTALGVEHIWVGIDHLLFVACLVFVAATPRRLLFTITGFTLAHSATLALSALDLVRVPVPPVEAAIALSVVFLAYEIAKGDKSSFALRYPIAVSTTFGLLHGFGFAAVLREIGLPQTELPTALLFFNVGVEIGQVLFVAALLAAYWTLMLAARLLGPSLTTIAPGATVAAPVAEAASLAPAFLTLPAAWLIGGVASFWMIERIARFWS